MKQSFRFLTMLLFATLFSATAFALDWVVPAPKASPMVLEDTFAIRNVGQNAFIYMGEAWGTQGIVDVTVPNGKFLLVRPQEATATVTTIDGDEVTFSVIELQDNSKGWGTHFIWRQPSDGNLGAGNKGCFVDNGGAPARYWNVAPIGNNVYTIQVPSLMTVENGYAEDVAYYEGEFLGIQTDHGSAWAASNAEGVTYGIYYDVVYADNPANCQWEFVKKADIDVYAAKTTLKEVAESASEKGIDVSAAKAVFDNPDATVAELEAATAALRDELLNVADWDNPVDVSDKYIVNATPTSGSNGVAPTGWTVTLTDTGTEPAPKYASNCGEIWNRSGGKISQVINLPAGVYRLTVQAYTRTGMEAWLAAGTEKMLIATVPSSEVNSLGDADTRFNNGDFVNTMVFATVEEGPVEISLTADSSNGDHWLAWRNWKLESLGSSIDSYKRLSESLSEGWEEEFIDKEYNQTYYDAVTEALSNANGATTREEAIAAYGVVSEAINSLRANAEAYGNLLERANEINEVVWNEYGADDRLIDILEGNPDFDIIGIFELIETDALSTEEAVAKLEELNALAELVKKELKQPGDDCSDMINNPTFRDAAGTNSGFHKWTVDSDNALQNNAGTIQVVEQWNGTSATSVIDVYQYVNLPKGAFRLATKGWYRSTTDYNTYLTNPDYQVVKSYLYGSASQFPFPDIYVKGYTDEEKELYFPNGNEYTATIDGITYHYPNNCTGAEELFTNPEIDCYDMYVDFIATGEPVKIGIKGTVVGYAWTIWDDFTLTFLGNDIESMKPIAEATIADAEALLDKQMSAEARTNLLNAINAARQAVDGAALVDAYVALGDVVDAANASINTYNRLKVANEELASEILKYMDSAKPEALEAANALNAEIEEGLAAGAYTDEQINDKIAEINEVLFDLRVPAGEASDDNPQDYTALIINPMYTSGTSGWTEDPEFAGAVTVEQENTSLGTQIGFAEGWNKSFNIYQDIKRLPEGTYRVKLQGLYRQEGTGTDAKTWKYGYASDNGLLDLLTDEEKENVVPFDPRAKIYANGDTINFARWIFLPKDDDEKAILQSAVDSEGSWTAFDDNLTDPTLIETYYYPNNRLALANRCDNPGWYDNEFYTYVDASGVLRLGACNKTALTLDWVPFSNWRLEYLGTESKYANVTGISEIAVGETVSKSIFTADGRRVNSLVKGMNILKTTSKDGKTEVKKVIVK